MMRGGGGRRGGGKRGEGPDGRSRGGGAGAGEGEGEEGEGRLDPPLLTDGALAPPLVPRHHAPHLHPPPFPSLSTTSSPLHPSPPPHPPGEEELGEETAPLLRPLPHPLLPQPRHGQLPLGWEGSRRGKEQEKKQEEGKRGEREEDERVSDSKGFLGGWEEKTRS